MSSKVRRGVDALVLGAIGEPFNLSLPAKTSTLFPLPEPIPMRFTVLEEKFVGRTVYAGRLMSVSDWECAIETELALLPLCNLKIQIDPVDGANPGGEIYGKVIGPANGPAAQTRVRFTSVSPDLKSWTQQIVARTASAPAVKA